ncbi:hypothetical protein [Lignipirellula cremea]|uniref:Uncharacterized protein n=1 Tax=Lignipirellula cremea TaxID=2528010 RepID=A0A518DZM6_9BACT|nr:hypothetical protein [Lignipirellula cremea]QDU97300.1 hypothetical protein Pla8534_51460 [Lignipirellula cremea]
MSYGISQNQDAHDLNRLGMFWYLYAAFQGVFLLAFLLMGGINGLIFFAARGMAQQHHRGQEVATFAPLVMFLTCVFAAVFFAVTLTLSIMVARRFSTLQGYGLCRTTSMLICLQMPVGTALGIYTLIVLGRDSIRARFGAGGKPASSSYAASSSYPPASSPGKPPGQGAPAGGYGPPGGNYGPPTGGGYGPPKGGGYGPPAGGGYGPPTGGSYGPPAGGGYGPPVGGGGGMPGIDLTAASNHGEAPSMANVAAQAYENTKRYGTHHGGGVYSHTYVPLEVQRLRNGKWLWIVAAVAGAGLLAVLLLCGVALLVVGKVKQEKKRHPFPRNGIQQPVRPRTFHLNQAPGRALPTADTIGSAAVRFVHAAVSAGPGVSGVSAEVPSARSVGAAVAMFPAVPLH